MICQNCSKPLDEELSVWNVLYDAQTRTLSAMCKDCQKDPLSGLLKQSEGGELEW